LTFHHIAVDLIFVVVEIGLKLPIGRVFSVTKRLIIAFGFLAAVPFAASASKLISCSTCDPTPVVLTSTDGTGALDVALDTTDSDQYFEYENDTDAVIGSLEFDATIDTDLLGSSYSSTTIVYNSANPNGEVTSGPSSGNPILANFQCDQVAGFFQNCTVTYNNTTGELSYLFAGTGQPDPPNSNINFGDWQGEEAGIPSCPAGFAPTECDSSSGEDYDRGLFELDFQGFQAGTPAAMDYSGPLGFTGSYTVLTPEPSYVLLLVSGLFLLWFVRRRKLAQ
jgi:hypothetical protein